MVQDKIQKKENRRRRRGLRMILIVVLLLCGVVTYNRYVLESEKKSLEKRQEELQEELDKARELGIILKERQIYMQTIPYIKEKAREMGLVDPGDIIFMPEPTE